MIDNERKADTRPWAIAVRAIPIAVGLLFGVLASSIIVGFFFGAVAAMTLWLITDIARVRRARRRGEPEPPFVTPIRDAAPREGPPARTTREIAKGLGEWVLHGDALWTSRLVLVVFFVMVVAGVVATIVQLVTHTGNFR